MKYLPFLFAGCTAFFWGLYGPTLAKARTADPDLSPFKPYVAIGVAYLVIAIIGGVVGMWLKGDNFQFTGIGARWGVLAGTLGALGALTLTLCMFTGGAKHPQSMMPIVFGGAVTITALYTIYASGGKLQASPMLWLGIGLMFVAVIIITSNTPHAAPPPGAGAAKAPALQQKTQGHT